MLEHKDYFKLTVIQDGIAVRADLRDDGFLDITELYYQSLENLITFLDKLPPKVIFTCIESPRIESLLFDRNFILAEILYKSGLLQTSYVLRKEIGAIEGLYHILGTDSDI